MILSSGIERSKKVRQLDVASAAGHAVGGAAAAMSLSANGKTKAGLFQPTKLSGAIQIAAEGRVFNGSVKTK